MKPFLKIATLLSLYTILISCNSNPLEEPISAEELLQPGRRDYNWEEFVLEPLENYRVSLSSMWGATPNNIWACGQAYLAKSQVWHFNGTTWAESGDLVPDRDQTAVWGSSANDIWMSNEVGKMFHFDGKEWTEKTQLKVDWYEYVLVNQIWGVSANEIYAAGFCFQPIPTSPDQNYAYGVVFKYDGIQWKQIKLPIKYIDFGFVRKDKDKILYVAAFNASTWIGEIYSYDGVSFKKLLTLNYIPNFETIGGYVYTQKEQKLYRLSNGDYTEWKDLTGTNFNGGILGARSIKDFFARSKNGIGHYNGTNFVQVYSLAPRVYVPATLLFEKDVFFLMPDYNINKTRILHGKLKD